MELKKLLNCKKGDILIYSGYNALEQCNGQPFEAEIKTVNRYTHPESSLTYTTFEVQYGDMEMIFLVKTIGDEYDVQRYTLWNDGSFSTFVDNVASDHEETKGLPTGFMLDVMNEGTKDEYLALDPFPLYGFQKNGKIHCGLGEYRYNGEADQTYCAKYGLMEWYLSDDEYSDDLDNYHALYFGNDVSLEDLEVLQG